MKYLDRADSGGPGDPLARCIAGLNDLLSAVRPERVLVGLKTGEARVQPVEHPQCALEVRRGRAILDPLDRMDAAVLFQAEGDLGDEPARHLLASLRDLHARRLLVVPHVEGWGWRELLALGFSRYASFTSSDAGDVEKFEIFGFSLEDYKVTPEWLNSRYWAHPELFGKFRW